MYSSLTSISSYPHKFIEKGEIVKFISIFPQISSNPSLSVQGVTFLSKPTIIPKLDAFKLSSSNWWRWWSDGWFSFPFFFFFQICYTFCSLRQAACNENSGESSDVDSILKRTPAAAIVRRTARGGHRSLGGEKSAILISRIHGPVYEFWGWISTSPIRESPW